MAPRKRSTMWNHFRDLENGTVKCGYCSKILSVAAGSFGNLNRHLRTVHPAVILSTPKPTEMVHNEDVVDDPGTPVESDTPNSKVTTKQQSSITNFLQSKKPVSIVRSKQLDDQVTRMIVKGYYSFRMVDDKEFRKFVEMLNPGYQLPCRQTVSKNLIPRLYNCTLEQLKQQIQSSTAICLTTDGWTCINNRGYIAITAHYIEPNGTLSSICLSCEEFNERHTSTNLANYLKNITVEWDINYKIVAIVTDNAPNITAAVREMKYRHIGCFAHSINLLVQHSLEHISTPLKKVKCIVEFFKKSSSALAKLHSAQKNMGLPQLKLKQDVVTRWNSTYDMLKRIISIKDAVISTLAILQSSIQVLTPAEWEVVEKAVDVLQIFHEVTEEISSEKTVSISKVIVLVTSMFHTVETFVLDINIPYEVNLMANSLKAQLKKRFEEIEDNEIISQAAILDPRFKQFGFKNENKFNKALSILRTRISNIKLPSDSNPQKPLETVTSTPQPTSSLLWKVYENKVGKLKSIQNPTAAGLIELDKYMQEPLIDRHDDPLKWWYERKSIYPRLYTFVLKRLCITATSVPCERIFSEAGQIITQKRNSLNTKKASQLIFLHNNL
ncbi:hypothetical protein QTP88_011338 [Uroleucon formosanum]